MAVTWGKLDKGANLSDVLDKGAARTNLGLTAGGTGYNVQAYGATGDAATDDTAAFNAALTAMPTVTISGVAWHFGKLVIPAGTYKLGSLGVDVMNLGPFVSVQGDGKGVSTLAYYGSGSALRVYNSVYPTSDTFDTLQAWAGTINGLTIDGTNCVAGASGLRYGDTEGGVIGPDIFIRSFNKTGCDGLLFDNQYAWLENMRVWANTYNCTNGVRFHGSGGTTGDNSFMYNFMDLKVYSFANQNGVVLDNGAYYVNGHLRIRANMANATSTQTGALLTITGVAPTGHLGAGTYAQVSNCHLEIQGETNGTGTFAPMTIRFGDVGANYIVNCSGIMSFGNALWTPSNWTLAGNFANSSFAFAGWISGDANLSPVNGGYTVRSAIYYGQSTLFVDGGIGLHQGDFFGPTVLTANMTVNFGGSNVGKPGPQRKTIFIQQNATTAYTVTWPKPASPTLAAPAVYWAGGTAPTMTATLGAQDQYNLVTYDGVHWYGQAIQNIK